MTFFGEEKILYPALNKTPCYFEHLGLLHMSLPPTRQNLTQGQWHKVRLIVEVKGRGGQAWVEARALLVIGSLSAMCARWACSWTWAHSIYITWVAWTRPRSPLLYNVINVACTPEGDPAETGGPFNLKSTTDPWHSIRHECQMASLKRRRAGICYFIQCSFFSFICYVKNIRRFKVNIL